MFFCDDYHYLLEATNIDLSTILVEIWPVFRDGLHDSVVDFFVDLLVIIVVIIVSLGRGLIIFRLLLFFLILLFILLRLGVFRRLICGLSLLLCTLLLLLGRLLSFLVIERVLVVRWCAFTALLFFLLAIGFSIFNDFGEDTCDLLLEQ